MENLYKYILKRLLSLIPILIGISFISFALIYFTGGDAVAVRYEAIGGVLSPELLNQKREELGLNRPFMVQYFTWLLGVIQGDMGISYVSGKPVFSYIMSKLPNTLLLSLSALFTTMFISLPLGILSAVKKNGIFDNIIRTMSFIGNSLPNFFVALVLSYIFALKMKLLPVISQGTSLKSLILPTLTLSLAMSAKYIRQIRSLIIAELSKPYVSGARARGIKENIIIFFNVLRLTSLTLITLMTLSFGSLLGGSSIVESIFMWDGIGKLAIESINLRDYPMILAYVLWMALIYVFVNLLADISYYFLDPRLRLGGGKHAN
ncbi:ABC transporter permease [Lachnoanaerobaculum umeaense]|jgi:oligopeptide ABC transporter, permease protein appB|uniref:ABC transporter permease n=1 Tax=Lachnoanaerobaculum umeaense TaxID=617123 RepID=A0A385Q2G2_9FIRM|nr:ABC transporter permease [Lachnoanaerobaculum umeaense]PZW92572.1 peptide/nickel transport system permease protein [Lachnoanaerobaculum umeaense]